MAEQTGAVAGSEPVAHQQATEAPQQTVQPGSEPANGTQQQVTEATANQTGSEPGVTQKDEPQEMKLRRRAQQAEQDAAYWRGVAEAGGQKKPEQPQAPVPQGPPKIEDFETYDDFLVAKAKFEIRQEEDQRSAERGRQEIRDSYTERFRKTAEKLPDLPQVAAKLADLGRRMPNPAMAEAIMASEIGPEIVHHLGNNMDEAQRIARMSPFAAAREIGKLEAKLSAPASQPPQRISQAPEPIKALGGKGSAATTDLERVSMDDFMKQRNTESPPGRRR